MLCTRIPYDLRQSTTRTIIARKTIASSESQDRLRPVHASFRQIRWSFPHGIVHHTGLVRTIKQRRHEILESVAVTFLPTWRRSKIILGGLANIPIDELLAYVVEHKKSYRHFRRLCRSARPYCRRR
jgi:hypothetical protein